MEIFSATARCQRVKPPLRCAWPDADHDACCRITTPGPTTEAMPTTWDAGQARSGVDGDGGMPSGPLRWQPLPGRRSGSLPQGRGPPCCGPADAYQHRALPRVPRNAFLRPTSARTPVRAAPGPPSAQVGVGRGGLSGRLGPRLPGGPHEEESQCRPCPAHQREGEVVPGVRFEDERASGCATGEHQQRSDVR